MSNEEQLLPQIKKSSDKDQEANKELAQRIKAQTGQHVDTRSFTQEHRELTQQLLHERRRSLTHLPEKHAPTIHTTVIEALRHPTKDNLERSRDSLENSRQLHALGVKDLIDNARKAAIENPDMTHEEIVARLREEVAKAEAAQRTKKAQKEAQKIEALRDLLYPQDKPHKKTILPELAQNAMEIGNSLKDTLPPLDQAKSSEPLPEVRQGGVRRPSTGQKPSGKSRF